ncbi:hypothetical protein UFOVP1290_443 [uncultured Caudovirales phage]|uniref:Uncharacterized protein n=1 Tax=uncultured Caudovirales phage TaxID=2100421 RepID=A0A6J5RHQ0_9CAUD|nr:hypothetical protein UFOVP1290_443 [uncultured Caudovirales phage]
MKKCNNCHVNKSLDNFFLKRDGELSKYCADCKQRKKEYSLKKKKEISEKAKILYNNNREKILQERKAYYSNNRDKCLLKNKEDYINNKEKYLKYKKEYYSDHRDFYSDLEKKNRKENPKKYMWKAAKKRAKEKNLPFNISIDDIVIPDICPILGLTLEFGSIEHRDNSPSLDKIIPELGYVVGNIKVISFKANTLKRDGHIEDFEKIIAYIKENKQNEYENK